MRHRILVLLIALAAVVGLCVSPVGAASQGPSAVVNAWNPPRTPDGQPDVQGFWKHRTPANTSFSIEDGAPDSETAVTGATRSHASVIVDPPNGRVPYQPWAAAIRDELKEISANPGRGRPDQLDPQARCYESGVPRISYQGDTGGVTHVIQPRGYVVIYYEYAHIYRVIPLDGSAHVGKNIKLWMGDSRGRWEGNTLVVDVTNQNGRTWYDVVGTFHSDALHVVERWTFINGETIHYEATSVDPQVFTKPWTLALDFVRQREPGYEVMEQACWEGERSVERMLGAK